MDKNWLGSLFWVLNGLTLGAFSVLLLFTVWIKLREGFHENLEAILAVILWIYMIFSIIWLGKYLIAPSPERDFSFLWLSLGLVFLTFLAFLFVIGNIGGLGPT